jgi:hypothetical protein
VAVAAAAIGAAVTLGVTDASSSSSPPSSSASSGFNTPEGSSGAGNGSGISPGGGGMSLGESGSGSGARVALILGKVTAVSSTSITFSTNQGSMTAAVASSTTFSGNVTNVSQVKVGDEVTVQLSANDSTITATSIEDPASTP